MIDVESYLQSHGITYIKHEHPAVFTCEEAEEHCADIPGLPCKNILLKNKKGTVYALVLLPAKKQVDLKHICEVLDQKKMSFASAERLKQKLGLDPGSVSPFGLLNNTEHDVAALVDKEVYDAETVSFHPNRNTATLELGRDMFHRFLESIENDVKIV